MHKSTHKGQSFPKSAVPNLKASKHVKLKLTEVNGEGRMKLCNGA